MLMNKKNEKKIFRRGVLKELRYGWLNADRW